MTRRLAGTVHRWTGRVVAAVTVGAVWVVLRMQPASAAPGDPLGQTPPALSWIELNDSHGISVWNYEMSLNRGGVTDPGKFFWSSVVDLYWGAYRSGCALALWFLDWVMSFDWLHIIASPLLSTGAALQSVVDRIGVVPTLLTIAAVVSVGWMAKGRYATGIWELAMSLLIATLATGVFAQPVQLVAGPDGLIMKAQSFGLELAAELSTGQGGSSSDPVQLRKQMTGQMVDTFVREPAQMINFGRVLDGGKCEKVYDEVVRGGPYGLEDDIRDKVNGCDSKLGDYADAPSAGMATGALMFEPASGIILLFAVVLAGSVIAAACYAMFQSLKAIVALVTALLPGGSRGSLFMTVAETAISLLIIVFTNVFLAVFLMVIQALFKDSAGASKPRTFIIFDVLLIVGIIVYWRYRHRLKESTQRLAQWMSQRPGGNASRLPDRAPGGAGAWAGRALTTASQLSMVRARRGTPGGPGSVYIDARRQAVGFFGAGGPDADSSGSVGVQPPNGGGGGPTTPTAPLPGPAGSPLARIGARTSSRVAVGTLARAGSKAALAAVTGGASTAAAGALTAAKATKALNTARRATVIGQLALPAGPTTTPPAVTAGPPPPGQPGPARPLPTTPTRPVLPAGPRHRPRPSITAKPDAATSPPLAGPPATAKQAARTPGPDRAAAPAPAPGAATDAAGRSTNGKAPSHAGRTSTASPSAAGAGGASVRSGGPAAARPSAEGNAAAGMRRQWDKVVRDGQVVLVPRTTSAPAAAPEDPPPAVRPPHRPRRDG